MKRSVLVVEDDESMLEYCTTLLALEGFEVTAVSCGEKALAELSARPFDIVLTDHVPMDAGTRTVAQAAKRLRPDSEVIVMSGMPTLADATAAYLAGAAKYLAKPFTFIDLRLAVGKCLDRLERRAPSPPGG